jgi:hypothetical protein
MREHKEEAEKPPSQYKANRTAKVGSTIAVYAAKSASKLFYLARVTEILADGNLKVHWWSSNRVEGQYTPQFKKPKTKKKGTAGPYLATIQKSSLINRVTSLDSKTKSKIPSAQLREIIRLATEFRDT